MRQSGKEQMITFLKLIVDPNVQAVMIAVAKKKQNELEIMNATHLSEAAVERAVKRLSRFGLIKATGASNSYCVDEEFVNTFFGNGNSRKLK